MYELSTLDKPIGTESRLVVATGSGEEKMGSDCLIGLISFEEKNKVYLSLKRKLLILLGSHPCLRPFNGIPIILEIKSKDFI